MQFGASSISIVLYLASYCLVVADHSFNLSIYCCKMWGWSVVCFNGKVDFTIMGDSNAALALVQMVVSVLVNLVPLLILHTNHKPINLALFILPLFRQRYCFGLAAIYQQVFEEIKELTKLLTRQLQLTTTMLNCHNCYLYFHFLHLHFSIRISLEQATYKIKIIF